MSWLVIVFGVMGLEVMIFVVRGRDQRTSERRLESCPCLGMRRDCPFVCLTLEGMACLRLDIGSLQAFAWRAMLLLTDQRARLMLLLTDQRARLMLVPELVVLALMESLLIPPLAMVDQFP